MVAAGVAVAAAGLALLVADPEPAGVDVQVLGATEEAVGQQRPVPDGVVTVPPADPSASAPGPSPTTGPPSSSVAASSTLVVPEVTVVTEVTAAPAEAPPPPPAPTAAPAPPSAPPAPTAPPPPSTAPPPPPVEPTLDTLGAEAEALIGYPFRARLDGWAITYLPGREGVRGLTWPAEQRIEIYVRDGDDAVSLSRVVAHEVGHALDITLLTSDDRQRWREVRGIDPAVPWWPDGTTYDFDTVAGDFAEAFAVWQTGVATRSNAAGQPTAEQLAVLAELVG
jgi:hypothetical protein